MSDTEEKQLKELMKEAFNEAIVSNREIILEAFFEALEEFNLLEAIKEGESSGAASREEVFAILEQKE